MSAAKGHSETVELDWKEEAAVVNFLYPKATEKRYGIFLIRF
jgi:hypothetical protein